MKKILTLLALVATITTAYAQSNGEIKGKITDETGEGAIGASVIILDGNGNNTGRGTVTDYDGNYALGPLSAGKYNLKFSYTGKSAQVQSGIIVSSDKTTFINVKLVPQTKEIGEITFTTYKKPLIDKGDTKIEQVTTAADIKNSGALSVENSVSTNAGVTQSDAGKGITINGGREDEVQYLVNGHRVIGGKPNVAPGSIKEISVLTGGISAKYGDVTSGIVNITLNDAQQSFGGNIEAKTTQGLDPYGTTRVAASLYGPLAQIKDKKIEGAKPTKRTILGFSGSFQYQQDHDRDPSAIGVYQIKDDVVARLRQSPKLRNPDGTFSTSAEYLTFADMYKTSAKPNNSGKSYNGSGEIGIYPTKNISLTVGGNYNYDRYHSYVRAYSLLNAEHNPLYTEDNYLIYGRFTQRIGEKKAKDGQKIEEKKSGLKVENAYYSVQFDYEKYKKAYNDETFGTNPFNYGYIGKFKTLSYQGYTQGSVKDSTDPNNLGHTFTGFVQNADPTPTSVIFTPGKLNPLGAQYTKQYYELLGATQAADGSYEVGASSRTGFTDNVSNIESNGGIRNGQRTRTIVYDNLWANIGRPYNGYGTDRNDESFRGKVDAAFDIVKLGSDKSNTHKIELGFEYEQRIQRNYSVSPLGLWDAGNTLVNSHISQNKSNPDFIIGGQHYSLGDPYLVNFTTKDTINFKDTANLSAQTHFDRSLRKVLGLDPNGTQRIDFFSIDPDKLSLNLFTADDLLQRNLVNYYGYDHKGNVLTSQPTLNDYFKQKDADGAFTRLQSAFMPTYAAGYIQDKFFYKDLGFVIGLRIDRYDANQYVAKDMYSLYEVKTAQDVKVLYKSDGTTTAVSHPGNIGSDYAVYVTDVKNGAIAGYRHGDDWFDKYGRPTTGQKVALESSGGLLPYINVPNFQSFEKASDVKNYIKTDAYDPSLSFTKYQAQYLFMPRLQFSFNLTDKAQFFAHYDVLSQRPQSRNQLQLSDYYYYENGGTRNNPNLKPITKIDYEFGFKQAIAEFASLTLSAFYQETRNLIQLRRIQYAYPVDYTTYDNIDFRTGKGVRILFDMRRVQRFKINANYTLQFVEGTGSDDQSASNLINSNQPNFRSIYPVSTDNRHQIKFAIDYRFESGPNYKGPMVGNHQILADFGINLAFNLRSGSPQRQGATVTDEATSDIGTGSGAGRSRTVSLNARLPWYSRLDLRVNKDYEFNISKKKEGKEPRKMGISIYVYIQNLLNTQNVLTQYAYTLSASDDGYLNATSSQVAINAKASPQAYKDLYRAKVNNPDNYSIPRRIFIGANINF